MQNKSCLEFIIEGVGYLFDESVKKAEIEYFVKLLPIDLNKKLIKKDIIDLTELPEEIQEKISNFSFIPIDFLITSVVQNFPERLKELQKNPTMIAFGKDIRKRNFSKKMIDKLHRLAIYFAIFFYESREHTIWRSVIDSLIKAPFTPEQLLKLLDSLYRRDAREYLAFYSVLSQNSSLTRISYLINSMQQEETKKPGTTESQTPEEIMSISKLNHYAHHWFPGIVLASVKHPNLYKTTLEKVYEELFKWTTLYQSMDGFHQYHLYDNQPETPQKINPQQNEILMALLSHNKIPSKILHKEATNNDVMIRKIIALSPNVTLSTLTILQDDVDEYVRKIALFKLVIMKKERSTVKKNADEGIENNIEKKTLTPNNIMDQFTENPRLFYF